MIQSAAKRYGFQILEHAAKISWPVLKHLYAQIAPATLNHWRSSRRPETEPEVWEITREEFEQELVGHHRRSKGSFIADVWCIKSETEEVGRFRCGCESEGVRGNVLGLIGVGA